MQRAGTSPLIAAQPGLSAWELAQESGLSYSDASRGLASLREFEAVGFEPEDREQGGVRYRHYPTADLEAVERFRRVASRCVEVRS